jgi:hypothetical protein
MIRAYGLGVGGASAALLAIFATGAPTSSSSQITAAPAYVASFASSSDRIVATPLPQADVSSARRAATVGTFLLTRGVGRPAGLARPDIPFDVQPVVTMVSPSSGPLAGGQSVAITGSGFTGATDVFFGDTVDCSFSSGCFSITDDNDIVATTPAGVAGTFDVTVVNDIGTSSPNPPGDQFTFNQPNPSITNVNPNTGSAAGGSPVIAITGTNFQGSGFTATDLSFNSNDVAVGGYPCPGSSTGCFKVISDTSISAYPPSGSGQVDITVETQADDLSVQQTSPITGNDQFTYVVVPAVTNVTPLSGPEAGGNLVVIAGSDFSGATDVFVGGPTTDLSECPTGPSCFTVNGAGTQITVSSFPSGAGAVHVTVESPGGTSAATSADLYTYAPIPTVTSVTPSSGPTGGGNQVVIGGSGFTGATDVFVGGSSNDLTPCPASLCFTFNSATKITVGSFPSGSGAVHVTVDTPGGTSAATGADLYTYGLIPTVTNVVPQAGPAAGGNAVVITGSDFTGATDVLVGAHDLPPCGASPCFTFNGATQVTITGIPSGTGTVDIKVETPGGTSATSGNDTYTYAPVPTVTSVVPNTGPTVGGNNVTITGTGFFSSGNFTTSSVSIGSAVTTLCPGSLGAPCISVNSATQIVLDNVPPHAAGPVSVSVTTPGGMSTVDATYTFALIPSVTNVTPAAGVAAGGTTVVITGSDFTGATDVFVGAHDLPPCGASPCFTFNGATQVTVSGIPPGTGTVDIEVETPGGTSVPTSSDTYTYVPVPTVTNVAPNRGSTLGGTNVTVTGSGFTGTNFAPTGVHVGADLLGLCTGSSSTDCYAVNSATVIFIQGIPAAAAGPVDITVSTIGGTSATSSSDTYTYLSTFPTVTFLTQTKGAAKGGAHLTIVGTNFSTSGFLANEVDFVVPGSGTVESAVMTTPCTPTSGPCFTVVGPTDISLVTPPGPAGLFDVRVIAPAGETGTNSFDQYTYVAQSAYTALTPFRVCDTRPRSPTPQCTNKTLGKNGVVTAQITGVAGPIGQSVPAGAQAVVVNVTAVNHSTTGTYVTAYPAGGSAPLASNINLSGGTVESNLAIVQLSAGGAISVYNAVGSVDVILDVQGYFTTPSGSAGEFHSIAPVRVCDTRAKGGTVCAGTTSRPLAGGTWRDVSIAGTGIPADGTAAAAVFNLTATGGTKATYLAVQPPTGPGTCPVKAPSASNLNPNAGTSLPIRVISPLGANHDICVFNALGSVNFIVDVNGWFGTSSAPPGALFYSIPPTRICDTRTGSGTRCAGAALTGNSSHLVEVAGVPAVPADGGSTTVVAVVANLTGISGTAPTFLELYPSDKARPSASDLNPSTHEVIANLAVVGLSTTSGLSPGDVSLYNAVGTINAILDVAGWFQ